MSEWIRPYSTLKTQREYLTASSLGQIYLRKPSGKTSRSLCADIAFATAFPRAYPFSMLTNFAKDFKLSKPLAPLIAKGYTNI